MHIDVHYINNSHATKSISVWTCGKCLLSTTSDYYSLVTAASLQQLRSTPRDVFPNVVCDYQAPDICNPNNQPVPCCLRPEVLDYTPTTMDTPTTVGTDVANLISYCRLAIYNTHSF